MKPYYEQDGTAPTATEAIALRDALLTRGHRLLTQAGKFFVSNASALTPADREAIKAHREQLIALAEPWIDPAARAVIDTANERAAFAESQSLFETTPSVSLAQFLGSEPPRVDSSYVADEPPDLTGIDTLAIDTETTGLRHFAGDRPIGISLRLPDGRCLYLPWGHAAQNHDENVVRKWAQRELRGKHIIFANAKFDIAMLAAWGVSLEDQANTVEDVQHTASILDDSGRRVNLDALAKDYLSKEKSGQDLDKTRMASYSAGEVAEYAKRDVALTGELYEKMKPLLVEQDLTRVQALENEVIYPTIAMETAALFTDTALHHQWCEETEKLYNEAIWEISREVGFSMSTDSGKDWERLFQHFNIPIEHMTEAGKPSFTDAVLKHVDNRIVQVARKAGKIASLRAKFLCAWRDVIGDDGILRYSLHQCRNDEYGTVRGRFSASSVNVQQVMNHSTHIESFGSEEFFVRRLFIPKSGLFVSYDADQIEYRIFAHFSSSPKILAAYAADPDLSYHRLVHELVKPFRPDIAYEKAKALNFCRLYSGGRGKIAMMLDLPRAESDKFVDIYDRLFPEVLALQKKATHLAETRGYVRSILGRRARFPDKKFAYKALNAVISPSASDIFKKKIVELHNERRATGFIMRAPIHDELIGDVPDEESARMIGEILNRQTTPLKVPIRWSGKTGRNWAECK